MYLLFFIAFVLRAVAYFEVTQTCDWNSLQESFVICFMLKWTAFQSTHIDCLYPMIFSVALVLIEMYRSSSHTSRFGLVQIMAGFTQYDFYTDSRSAHTRNLFSFLRSSKAFRWYILQLKRCLVYLFQCSPRTLVVLYATLADIQGLDLSFSPMFLVTKFREYFLVFFQVCLSS